MAILERLNDCAAVWSALMMRSLVEASALLIVAVLVWLALKRRVSSQFSYGLFLLVLAKAAVPLPITLPANVARLAPWRSLDRLTGASERRPVRATPSTRPMEIVGAGETLTMPRTLDPEPVAVRSLARAKGEAAETPVPPPADVMSRAGVALSPRAWLMAAWGVLVLALASRLVWVHVRMSRRLRDAEALDPACLPVDYVALCHRVGLGPVPVATTEWVATPAVWGVSRPRVLLPPGLVEVLTPGQLSWVLLHELVHIRRRDTWVVTLQRLLQVVYVFHPAVWVANRLIDVQREFACDDAALACAADVSRRDCGAGFLAVIERASAHPGSPLALGLFGSNTFLRRRLMRILDARRPLSRRLSTRALLLLGLSALVALPYVRAQDDPPAPPPAPVQAAKPPAPPAEVQVMDFRVVDLRTNLPLPGVDIRAQANRETTNGVTDDQGSYPVALPDGPLNALGVWVKKDGYVPVSISWGRRGGPLQRPKDYTLKLEPVTTIGGIIQDEQGRPVEGATVFVLVPGTDLPGQPRASVWDHPSKTDAQGRWSCALMPSKLDDVWLRLSHPDYISDTSHGKTPKPPMERLRDRTGVMVLKKGATVAGNVLDADGTPVKGAVVAQGSDRFGTHHPDTETDPQGRFTFRNVAPGKLILTVQARGHAPALKELEVSKGGEEVELRLGPGRTILGRVVDPRGLPLAGAMVAADTWRGHRSLSYRVSTDAEGRWRWDDAPEDTVLFDFAQDGFMYARRRPLAPSDQEQTISLVRPLTVRGSVTDAETGRPLERFTVLGGIDFGTGRQPSFERGSARPSSGGRYEIRFEQPYPYHLVRIEADGYLAEVSRKFRSDEGEQVFDVKLRRGAGLDGVARRPDGTPLAGADVILIAQDQGLSLVDGRATHLREDTVVTTGTDGRFHFPAHTGPVDVIVMHDLGIGRGTDAELRENPDLLVEPWGRIEGTLRIGPKPGREQAVGAYLEIVHRGSLRTMSKYEARTDAEGRFVIDRVVPGPVTVHRSVSMGRGTLWTHLAHIDVAPGGTTRVVLGGRGRPVVGRVVGPGGTAPTPDLVDQFSMIQVAMPPFPTPPEYDGYDAAKRQAWREAFGRTEEGKAYYRLANRYGVTVAPDGSFRAEDVPPGRYKLTISLARKEIPAARPSARANVSREVVVPEAAGGDDAPFDVGDVELTIREIHRLGVGDAVPGIQAKTLDGQPFSLADFRGKYVLLDFWATWCMPCLEETPHLKTVYEAHGKDERFRMVGLSLDEDAAAPRRYAEAQGLGWIQAFLGRGKEVTTAADFGVQGIPSTWLIGPDGRVIVRDLRGAAIEEAVARALATPP